MGTQKGRLFELARMYRTYQSTKNINKQKQNDKREAVEVKGEHYDEGKSISLAYNMEMYPEVLYDSHQRHSPAMQMSFLDNERSEAFYVEPFEAEETVDASYREVRDDEDSRLENIVRGFSDEFEEPEAMKQDEEKLEEMEEKLDNVFKPQEEARGMEAEEPRAHREEDDKPEHNSDEKKEDTPAVEKKGETQPYEASDEEFARDIGAILKGQKVYDADQKKAVNKNAANLPEARQPVKADSPGKASSPEELLDPNKNEHKIFEKIAQSMTYANSYDLGSIALEEHFEKIEKEIEKDEVDRILRTNPAAYKDTDIAPANVVDEGQRPTSAYTTYESSGLNIEKYNPQIPLDHTNGGRMINESHLQKGDLILASSSAGLFDIMEGSKATESIAGIYAGNNKLLAKSEAGVLEEKTIRQYLNTKGVMVALRHQNMTNEKASSIIDALDTLRVSPRQPENWLKVNAPAITLHESVCNAQEESDRTKCNVYAGKIYLGTITNDSFLCAESIINIFEKNQLGFVPPLTKEHNGSLKYLGHLKNKV